MAIQWGDWDYSGSNGIRVGIEVDWSNVTNSSTTVTATVDIYTQNQYSYDDSQTLTYGGALSGSTNFTNNDGSTAQLRATKTYTYTYGSSSYGSSPATKTFTASLSGAYDGVTPSVSKNHNVPARPYAAPNAPTSASASRVSDTLATVSWVNNATAGRPWSNVQVDAEVNASGSWFLVTAAISGAASAYNAGMYANEKRRWRVWSINSVGSAGPAYTSNYVWSTPAAPTSATRTQFSPTQQNLSWVNNAGYPDYVTDLYYMINNNGTWVYITSTAAGVTTYSHAGLTAANRYKYLIRTRCTGNNLYADAPVTTESAGTTTPPLAPTNLSPNGTTIDPSINQNFSWTFQPGQVGDTQTKYQVRHRLSGSSTWTTTSIVSSTSPSYTLPGGTYSSGQTIEWQVATHGADATQGPFSASANIQFTSADSKLPVWVDRYTGEYEMRSDAMGFCPTGSILMWPSASIPTGWLLCDGNTFSATTYPALNTVLGGNTLPNLMQRFPMGAGDNAGITGAGASVKGVGGLTNGSTVTLTATELPAHAHGPGNLGTGGQSANHTHSMNTLQKTNAAGNNGAADNSSDAVVQGAGSGRFNAGQSGSTNGASVGHTHTVDTGATASAGSGAGFSVMPPYYAVNFIIKAA